MSLALSNTDVANMSLSHLGVGKVIADLDTEKSQEASAIRQFYDTAVVAALRDCDWGFARDVVTLALVTDFRPKAYPNEWNFAYQYPAGVVIVRGILSGNRNDTLDSAVPWQQRIGQNGKLIMTDMDMAAVRVTKLISAEELFPPDFVLALSMLIASLIAPRLSNGDPLGLGQKVYQKYMMFIATAEKNDAIEGNADLQNDSDMVRARD